MSAAVRAALLAIEARFISANKIPEEYAIVPAHEWHALRQALADAIEEQPVMRANTKESE